MSSPHHAPVEYDGSFLNSCCVDLEAEYHEYARLPETPGCPDTGVPLIIHPKSGKNVEAKFSPDLHHPESPRSHSHLQEVGGLALRHSRVQRTSYYAHHMCEHNTFRGPYLPHDNAKKLERVLLNVAGYIPEQAIFFKGPNDYKLVTLSPKIRERMWNNKSIFVERPGMVAEFIKNYLFDVSSEIASKQQIAALLEANEPAQKWLTAKDILRCAALETSESFQATFLTMRDRRLLPGYPVPAAPISTWRPHRLMISALGNRDSEKTHVSRDLQAFFAGEVEASAAA